MSEGLEIAILGEVERIVKKVNEPTGSTVDVVVPNTLGYIPTIGTEMTMERGTKRVETLENTWCKGFTIFNPPTPSATLMSQHGVSAVASDGSLVGIMLGGTDLSNRYNYSSCARFVFSPEGEELYAAAVAFNLSASATTNEQVEPLFIKVGVDKWILVITSDTQAYKTMLVSVVYDPITKVLSSTNKVSYSVYSGTRSAIYDAVNNVTYLVAPTTPSQVDIKVLDGDANILSETGFATVNAVYTRSLMVPSVGGLIIYQYNSVPIKFNLVSSGTTLELDVTFTVGGGHTFPSREVPPLKLSKDKWFSTQSTDVSTYTYDVATNKLNGVTFTADSNTYTLIANAPESLVLLSETKEVVVFRGKYGINVFKLDANLDISKKSTIPEFFPSSKFPKSCNLGDNVFTYVSGIRRGAYLSRGFYAGKFTPEQLLGRPSIAKAGKVKSANLSSLTLEIPKAMGKGTLGQIPINEGLSLELLPTISNPRPEVVQVYSTDTGELGIMYRRTANWPQYFTIPYASEGLVLNQRGSTNSDLVVGVQGTGSGFALHFIIDGIPIFQEKGGYISSNQVQLWGYRSLYQHTTIAASDRQNNISATFCFQVPSIL